MRKVNVNDYLTIEEIQELLKKSNWKAAFEFLHTRMWIAFAFVYACLWLKPFASIIAMFIIGGT